MEHHDLPSALSVTPGIDPPEQTDLSAIQRFIQSKKKKHSEEEFFEAIRTGNRMMLSKAITLIESSLPEDQKMASKIIHLCLPYSGNSIRIGITGVPGVGKSTFIESLGTKLTLLNHKLAVLAIDPSSERSGGSILGDKTRMEQLGADPNAFIRPSPSAGALGGVARKTRESIILCEAAGFDIVFVETVGVGQSEIAVHSMVDFFLLLMLAGAGDELQGIKRGIMEMADAIVITKADSSNKEKAQAAQLQYQNALNLFPPSPSAWKPLVQTCSAIENKGIEEVWNTIREHAHFTQENRYFYTRRAEQASHWMYESIHTSLKDNFYQNKTRREKIKNLEELVSTSKLSPFEAAQNILDEYFRNELA